MSRGEDGPPIGPLAPTQAEIQLKALLHRQLDTSLHGVEDAFLRRRVDFAGTTNTLVDSMAAASGVRTRREFADIEATHQRLQELRDLGLRTEQICLRLEQEGYSLTEDLQRKRKKRKLVHPDHLKTESEDVERCLRERAAAAARNVTSAPRDLPQLSRHEREIERTLLHGKRADSLGRWLVSESSIPGRAEEAQAQQPTAGHRVASSAVQAPTSDVDAIKDESEHEEERLPAPREEGPSKKKKRRKIATTSTETFNSSRGLGDKDEEGGAAAKQAIVPFDRSFIEAHRLALSEIRQLPRFAAYEAGSPSRTLYIKNLAETTTKEDLVRIFLSFQKPAEELRQDRDYLEFRLLQGRMRGQAFVTFPSVEDAVAALAAVNGFVFKEGKPLIIHYGKGENKRGNDQSGGDHSEE